MPSVILIQKLLDVTKFDVQRNVHHDIFLQ